MLPGIQVSSPSHIVLHVGTNDVGRAKKHKLFSLLDNTLGRLHDDVFPNALIIWSDILPRRTYSGFGKDEQPKLIDAASTKQARQVHMPQDWGQCIESFGHQARAV